MEAEGQPPCFHPRVSVCVMNRTSKCKHPLLEVASVSKDLMGFERILSHKLRQEIITLLISCFQFCHHNAGYTQLTRKSFSKRFLCTSSSGVFLPLTVGVQLEAEKLEWNRAALAETSFSVYRVQSAPPVLCFFAPLKHHLAAKHWGRC